MIHRPKTVEDHIKAHRRAKIFITAVVGLSHFVQHPAMGFITCLLWIWIEEI